MKKKFKIRWWVIVITGGILGYVIAPILAAFSLNPTKPNLSIEAVILYDSGRLLILIGFIVGIINWLRMRSAKKQKNK